MGSIRDIYTTMFHVKGIMPDVVARQNPILLFQMLDGLNQEINNENNENVPDEWSFFYGK